MHSLIQRYIVSQKNFWREYRIDMWRLGEPFPTTVLEGKLIKEAESFLKRGGIRDLVIRHEGTDNEQRLSHVLALFAYQYAVELDKDCIEYLSSIAKKV